MKLVPIDPKSLPQDSEILRRMVVDLTQQLDKTNRLLRQLVAAKSGTRSEQLSADQLRLFAQELGLKAPQEESKPEEKASGKDDDPPPAGSPENAKPRGRQALPRHLKRERIVHDLDAAQKHCSDCEQDLRHIGEEVSERYEYQPAQMLVVEDACQTYACSCSIRTATKPPQPIAKSSASASVLAYVIVSKLADHLPLHRQAKMFRRWGVEISTQTIGGWMRQTAELLSPLYERLKTFVLSSEVIGTDDTPVRVLDKSLPGTTRKGRFWPYVGDPEHRAVVFDYTPTRERAGPEKFLQSYRGYVQADAYAAYDRLFTDPKRGLVEVACWAHARRHFHQALEHDPARMGAVLVQIGCLYAVEKTARNAGLAGEDMRLLRQQAAAPVLRDLHAYLLTIREEVLPKSAGGLAVNYALKNWTALTRYCKNGDLPIDNNRTERSLRGIAVGRHNWLFVGSNRAGRNMAVLNSFVGSCQMAQVDPFAWFRDVLTRIGQQSIQALDELLPHRWAAAQ